MTIGCVLLSSVGSRKCSDGNAWDQRAILYVFLSHEPRLMKPSSRSLEWADRSQWNRWFRPDGRHAFEHDPTNRTVESNSPSSSELSFYQWFSTYLVENKSEKVIQKEKSNQIQSDGCEHVCHRDVWELKNWPTADWMDWTKKKKNEKRCACSTSLRTCNSEADTRIH